MQKISNVSELVGCISFCVFPGAFCYHVRNGAGLRTMVRRRFAPASNGRQMKSIVLWSNDDKWVRLEARSSGQREGELGGSKPWLKTKTYARPHWPRVFWGGCRKFAPWRLSALAAMRSTGRRFWDLRRAAAGPASGRSILWLRPPPAHRRRRRRILLSPLLHAKTDELSQALRESI